MEDRKIKVRVRLIIIKNNKILLSYTKDEDFYFFIGGKLEFGETLKEACAERFKKSAEQISNLRKFFT